MIWYLKHSQHGYKIAHDRVEYEGDLKHGWKEYDPIERDREISAKLQKFQTPVATNLEAGTVSETSEEVSQVSIPPVKRKYTKRIQTGPDA